jgi:excisionase family DNA binding protein
MTKTTLIVPERLAKLEAGVYSVGDIAKLLQASERHVWRLHDGGKMPACIHLGRLVRWPKKLIDDWILNGCPAQSQASRRERPR